MLRYAIAACAVVFVLPASASAQVAAGEITGIVKDQAGAAIPRATVTVTGVATNRQRVVVSSGEGVYTAPSLAPGDYRIEVALTGFRPMRRDGIHLETGEKARIDFDLVVGGVREQVTVTADLPMLRAETASLGTVVDHTSVVQLPLNGRAFITLASLAPGVALPPNSQLPRAGVPTGEAIRGAELAKSVFVIGADGYRAVFALAELDSAFTDRIVLLADKRDGAALADNARPYQLIVPGEKRPARWVRQVVSIEVR